MNQLFTIFDLHIAISAILSPLLPTVLSAKRISTKKIRYSTKPAMTTATASKHRFFTKIPGTGVCLAATRWTFILVAPTWMSIPTSIFTIKRRYLPQPVCLSSGEPNTVWWFEAQVIAVLKSLPASGEWPVKSNKKFCEKKFWNGPKKTQKAQK